MHRLTCGFQELSLSVLEIQGKVKEWMEEAVSPFSMRTIPLPKNHPFGNKLFTKNMYHYLSIAHI